MNTYISSDDITDNIVAGFDLSAYLTEAFKEIEDLSEEKGVRDSDDIASPLHYKMKRYAICFVIMRLCQDKMGTNNLDIPELEKYVIKYNMYRKELAQLKDLITFEMITGNINALRDRAVQTGIIFRG
jgi:hypothetical protein